MEVWKSQVSWWPDWFRPVWRNPRRPRRRSSPSAAPGGQSQRNFSGGTHTLGFYKEQYHLIPTMVIWQYDTSALNQLELTTQTWLQRDKIKNRERLEKCTQNNQYIHLLISYITVMLPNRKSLDCVCNFMPLNKYSLNLPSPKMLIKWPQN